jgi:hypothetical protein
LEQIIETGPKRYQSAHAAHAAAWATRLGVAFAFVATFRAHVPNDGGTRNGRDTDPN